MPFDWLEVSTGEPVGETGHNTVIVRLKKCRTLEVRAEANIAFDQQEVSDYQTVEFHVARATTSVIGSRSVPTVPSSVTVIPSRDADPLPRRTIQVSLDFVRPDRHRRLWLWHISDEPHRPQGQPTGGCLVKENSKPGTVPVKRRSSPSTASSNGHPFRYEAST